jgi:hypothetical protein
LPNHIVAFDKNTFEARPPGPAVKVDIARQEHSFLTLGTRYQNIVLFIRRHTKVANVNYIVPSQTQPTRELAKHAISDELHAISYNLAIGQK